MDRYDDLLLKARAEMLGKNNLRKAPTKDTLFNMVWDRVVKAPEFDNEMYQQMRQQNAQARFDERDRQQTADAKAQGWTDPFGQINHGADLEGAPRSEASPQGMRANFQAGREQTRDTSQPGMMGKVGGWLKDKFSRKPTEAAEGAPPTLQEEPPMSADDRRHAEIDQFIDRKGGGRPRDTGGPSTSAGTQMPPNMEEIYRQINSGKMNSDNTPKPTPTQNTKPNMGMSIVESYIRTWGREPDEQWVRMNAPDEYEDWVASKNPPAEPPMPSDRPPLQESSPEYRPEFEMPTPGSSLTGEFDESTVSSHGDEPMGGEELMGLLGHEEPAPATTSSGTRMPKGALPAPRGEQRKDRMLPERSEVSDREAEPHAVMSGGERTGLDEVNERSPKQKATQHPAEKRTDSGRLSGGKGAKDARAKREEAYGGKPAPKEEAPKPEAKEEAAPPKKAKPKAEKPKTKTTTQGTIFSGAGKATDMSASARKKKADAAKEAPAKEEAPKSNRKALAAERSKGRQAAKKKRQ